MFDFASVLKLLPAVGPVVAALPEFRKVFDQIVGTFNATDQGELREAYADVIADNDIGHQRLQSKLDKAAREG